jgi:hypothetical protein
MKNMGSRKYALWDEEDGFFYYVPRFPDGSFNKFRVRSLVGIIPIYAAETLKLDDIDNFQEFKANFQWFVNNRKELTDSFAATSSNKGGTVAKIPARVKVIAIHIKVRYQQEVIRELQALQLSTLEIGECEKDYNF